MGFDQDLAIVEGIVRGEDPSFRDVAKTNIEAHIARLKASARTGVTDAFLLDAMALLALPGNAHTRVIPNQAISILPLRLVCIGRDYRLMTALPEHQAFVGQRLVAINGLAIETVEAAARPYLAGPPQRQRVIGGLCLVWPEALRRIARVQKNAPVEYHFQSDDGADTNLTLDQSTAMPGAALYPRNEHGQKSADWTPDRFIESKPWPNGGYSIRLPSFFDPSEQALSKDITHLVAQVADRQPETLLIDVRGNTGGDFTLTLPLLDVLERVWTGARCAVLVVKFTFSAAIVFAVLLRHRLRARLTVYGEAMGDGLRFYAEGGLADLPQSGATIRYSTAWHDWETGRADATTPANIAQHLVGVGAFEIDTPYVGATHGDPLAALYRRILEA